VEAVWLTGVRDPYNNDRLTLLIGFGGAATLAAYVALAVSQASLGSPLFFSIVAVPCIVYLLLVARLLRAPWIDAFGSQRRLDGLLLVALLLAVGFRVPLTLGRIGPRNDMIRYIWDGRIQWLGYNPYTVLPSDPALAYTHTDDTRVMPSIHDRTPYPAAAQLFFRLIVGIYASPHLMRFTLVGCDLLTIAVVLAWLRDTGRAPSLALLYAWNPLVVLEVAHSGHMDALGALWIAVSAWMLSTRRGMRATIAFVIAVASKLLPIVLLPLFWKRVRLRDAIVAAGVLLLLYLPFASAGMLPLGAVPNVVEYIRFNGPLFKLLAAMLSPKGAAAAAVAGGLAVAAWMRYRCAADEPAAWAWPMAVALAAAPVIYPWYLLYLTPFLLTSRTIPLTIWTIGVIPVYLVWELARYGHRWSVPMPIVYVEYGSLLAAMALSVVLARRTSDVAPRTSHLAPRPSDLAEK
jgi:alpha-1,6-mannosyltransferase